MEYKSDAGRYMRLGALNLKTASPSGTASPKKTTADIHKRIYSFSLEDVLCACVRECREMFHMASTGRDIGGGPYKGFSVTLPGLAYVARQALVICDASGRFSARLDRAVTDFVARAAVDAMHHVSISPEPDAPLDHSQAVGMLLAWAGWQFPFLPNEMARRIPRYLALFEEPIAAHSSLGRNLGETFAHITGFGYSEFIGVVMGVLAIVLNDESFSPAFSLESLKPLWAEPPWNKWCTQEMVKAVLARLSLTLDEHRRLAAEGFPESGVASDEPFSFNPLLKWPFVRLNDEYYIAPIPQYALTRVTEGATFDIADHYRDENPKSNRGLAALGNAVEGYVGRLLHHAYGEDSVLNERAYRDGTRGPDFVIINNRSVLLVEVKKAQPTLPINERGDMEMFENILRRDVVNPLRRLPGKEANVFADDRLPAYLLRGHRAVSHAVVTLGAFVAQPLWWSALITPQLRQEASRELAGPAYDMNREHHLLSVAELEEATVSGVPRLNSLLNRSWKQGAGYELASVLQGLRKLHGDHGILDPVWSTWSAVYYDHIPTKRSNRRDYRT